MLARIYQPARTATQSGQAKTHHWVLEFAPGAPRELDPLMGWTGSSDTQRQVRLSFESKEAALEYARAHRLEAVVLPPQGRKPNIRPGGYADNFAHSRRTVWTH